MGGLTIEPTVLAGLAESSEESERRGALVPASVEALGEAGVFRALVPAAFGGGEAHPGELITAIEAIAAADGSAGWCAAIGATSGLVAGYLPEPSAAELFSDPGTIAAGVFAPRGDLEQVGEGRLQLSGRWPLASGISHATLVGLGCVDRGRGPLYAVLRRDEVEVVETWDALGLRATASHDAIARAVEIPSERVTGLLGGEPVAAGALYSFPLFGLLAVSIAAVCTGIAVGALAEVVASTPTRQSAGSSRSLAERATTQERVAAAEARLRAARAGVESAIGSAWARAAEGERLSVEERLGLRLAATHAAISAVEVVDAAHRLGGSGALYRGTLERRLRDVHTAAQHMIVAPATLELSGRLLLGLDTDTAQL